MTTLTAAGYQGETSVHTRGLLALADAVARLSGGEVKLAIEPNVTSSGRKATAALADVEAGRTDLCYFASSYLGERVPALSALDIPFAPGDRAEIFRRIDGEAGRCLATAVAAATGFAVAAFWDNGFRHLSNGVRPLRTPSDCRGLTLRTLDSALQREVFARLGFRPVTIDVKDLARAVASGEVDAQENPLTNTVNFDLHRHHRFHSLTAHVHGVALVLTNRERAAAWPPAIRAILGQAIAEATSVQRGFAADEDAHCLATLRASGAEILQGDDLDLAAFQDAVAPIRQREIGRIDPALASGLGLA